MAKVTDLKFTFNGEEKKVPVNCGADGIFKTKIPQIIATSLKIESEISDKSLEGIRFVFYTALNKYKDAETTQTLFIAVKYQASGKCTNYSTGASMFNGWNSPFTLDAREKIDAVGLTYKIVMSETIDGIEQWYDVHIRDEKFNKGQVFYGKDKWRVIEYNLSYIETLDNAIENLRRVSEMMYKFIQQDKETMQLTLSKGKLLLGA